MDEQELVPVYDAMDEIQAVLHRELLEEAGFDVMEREYESDIFVGVRQNDLHSQLLVHSEDAERASQLIAEYNEEAEDGDLEIDDTDNDAEAADNSEK